MFLLLEQLVDRQLFKLIRPLCKIQDDHAERDVRSRKMANQAYKGCYYIGVSVWFYFVIAKDQDWLPKQLGGAAPSMRRAIETLPYPKFNNGIEQYFLVTAGYHMAGLISIMLGKKRRDFLEMTLHHFICIFLYSGGYLMNIHHPASIVAFLHDSSDILACCVKMLGETKYDRTNIVLFIAHMASWGYNRLVYFPILIYEIHVYSSITDWNRFCVFNFTFLLSCLCMLHYYWYALFFRILYKYFTKGVREDLIQKTEMKDKTTLKVA